MIVGAGTKIGKWNLDAQIWRDIELKKTTQQEYTMHYSSQCWGWASCRKKAGEKLSIS